MTPRISSVQGAQEAGFADWPNMCIVLKSTTYRGDDFDLYQCGASMISPGIILTAAHCVEYAIFICHFLSNIKIIIQNIP